MGTWSFPGVKAAEAWRWPPIPFQCRGYERVELYLYSPSGPGWPATGWNLYRIYAVTSVQKIYCDLYPGNMLKLPSIKYAVMQHSYRYLKTYIVHLWLFCTMTNKCTIISQIITLLHVSTLSCHPQVACNQYLAKLHKYFKCSCW